MTLDQLQLFKDIAQTRSISRGASMNGVSQSAASQRIQEIERSLSTLLLDRSSRPLRLTDSGRLYLDLCRDVLRRQDEFRASVDQLKTDVEGAVRVSAIYSVGLSEMSDLEREFLRRYPRARLDVEYLRPERVYETVRGGAADLGLMSYAEPSREVVVLPWREEEMVVAVPPTHALASRADLEPPELDGLSFVAFDEDLPIRRHIDAFLREHGAGVRMALHFDNLQMIKEAVAHGAGISILPRRLMRAEILQGRLIPIAFRGAVLFRPLSIVHARRKRFHRAAEAFLDLLRQPPA